MKIHAILNAKAGTLIDADAKQIASAVEKRLRADGNEVQLELTGPAEIEATIDRALAEKPDILAIGGGDGTILAAAKKLAGTRTALGIIPLGTLNRLARDLKIPFDPEQAATIIVDGKRAAIDVADVNGHMFLCNSLLGLPIRVTEQRRALRGRSFAQRLSGYFGVLKNFLSNRRRFTIEVDDGNIKKRVRALSIAISNNPLSQSPGVTLTRERLDGGQLALYLSKHRSGGAMGWTVVKRILGLSEDAPETEESCASRIVLRSHRSKVRVSNDGEIEELETPLRYSIAPGALTVMAPKAD